MLTYAYDYGTHYQIIATDGTDHGSFSYEFGKGQDVEISVTESVRLAEFEISRNQPPTPVILN